MDEDLLHSEGLLHCWVTLVDRIFSQRDREALMPHLRANTRTYNRKICNFLAPALFIVTFLPFREAVGSCDDPAGRYQTSPTAENILIRFATPEDSSDPWVRFHSRNCSTHNLCLPLYSPLATCQLCSWKGSQIQNCCWKTHTWPEKNNNKKTFALGAYMLVA